MLRRAKTVQAAVFDKQAVKPHRIENYAIVCIKYLEMTTAVGALALMLLVLCCLSAVPMCGCVLFESVSRASISCTVLQQ